MLFVTTLCDCYAHSFQITLLPASLVWHTEDNPILTFLACSHIKFMQDTMTTFKMQSSTVYLAAYWNFVTPDQFLQKLEPRKKTKADIHTIFLDFDEIYFGLLLKWDLSNKNK